MGGTLEGKWEKHKLYRRTRDVRELHHRSDLVEITDVSMRVFFVMSEKLFVLNEGKQSVLKIKVVRGDLRHNDDILVTHGSQSVFIPSGYHLSRLRDLFSWELKVVSEIYTRSNQGSASKDLAEEISSQRKRRKSKTPNLLLMALPEDHLAKFHKMTDAKEMWDAIKSRFGGNDESKKMQKYILKQQFEGFSISNSEGLHKGYDRFQSLLSQLEIHGAGVDSLSFDDLYNNLRVFENDVKGPTASSSSTQNVAFVSKNTSSTNDVSTAYSVSNTSGQNSQYEQTSSYSLLANQSSCPQLDHEDLEQLDEFDLEE
ncbi:hypothetical protein Tco_0687513 [Tanacetum coccineum]